MVCVFCVFGMIASYFWKFEKARRTAANRDVFGSAGQNSNTVVPHIFVWGSCFWFCIPPPPSASSQRLLLLPLTHNLSTHHLSSHNLLTHTLSSHNLSTHNLFHTYSHTTCPHRPCSHTTCPRTTCHHTTCPHRPCSHTTCPHTTCPHLLTHNLSTLTHTQLVHTQLVHTYSHTTCPHRPCSQLVHLHLAGLVLGDIDLHFVGQAWHVWHWAVSGGALGPEWPGWSPRLLAWQAWRFETSTFVSRGRRCTW